MTSSSRDVGGCHQQLTSFVPLVVVSGALALCLAQGEAATASIYGPISRNGSAAAPENNTRLGLAPSIAKREHVEHELIMGVGGRAPGGLGAEPTKGRQGGEQRGLWHVGTGTHIFAIS